MTIRKKKLVPRPYDVVPAKFERIRTVAPNLRAFHGSAAIKTFYLARVHWHREHDELVKGVYYEKQNEKVRACGVGCTIHSNDHSRYETELGIPRLLARLEDGIFEGLDNDHAKDWPTEFLEAIPVGADLSLVWPKFAVWLLGDPQHGVLQYATTESTRQAIQLVLESYQAVVKRKALSKKPWSRVRFAVATDVAAYTAAYAAAADAAAYATSSAASDALDAAYAASYAAAAALDATYAAAYTDADDANWEKKKSEVRFQQSRYLLHLLRETP